MPAEDLRVATETRPTRNTDYVRGGRKMIEMGVPSSDVFGVDDGVTVNLLFRNRSLSDKFDCASWACEIYRRFIDNDQFVRLVSAVFLTYMIRVSY